MKSTDKCNVYIICLITRNYCRLQICFVQIYISEVPNLKLKRCMILRFIRACLFLLCCFCYFSVCIALWSLFGVSLITAGLFIASALFKKKIKSAICCEMLKIKNTEEKLYVLVSEIILHFSSLLYTDFRHTSTGPCLFIWFQMYLSKDTSWGCVIMLVYWNSSGNGCFIFW